VMTGGINHEYYWAYDMNPMAPYVRLVMKDPSNPDHTPLAYDYRAPGLDEYRWEVEMTTTYPEIDARFSITDFAQVPDEFSITLQDAETGQLFELDGDESFNIELFSGSAKTYLLTAVMKSIAVDESHRPSAFGITGISPNPFNPATTINYVIESSDNVTIRIYNLGGQLVETLADTRMSAGAHRVVWNAAGQASGVYIVVVESGGLKDTGKITLMK